MVMDIRTALFWNHIFGSPVWALLMMIGLSAIIVGIVLRKHKKVRNVLLISGFLSVVLFVLSCVGSIYTYVEISRYRPEDEYETTKPIESKIIDHVYLGYPDEEINYCTVRYTNNTDEEINFGGRYKLEIEIDGRWFDVEPEDAPVTDPMWVETDVFILQPGETSEIEFNLTPYADLEPARYRFVISDDGHFCCYSEFELTESGDYLWAE